MEATLMSTDKWIRRHAYICKNIYKMEYYSAIKRMIVPSAATWMDLQGVILLSELSQTEEKANTYHLYVE